MTLRLDQDRRPNSSLRQLAIVNRGAADGVGLDFHHGVAARVVANGLLYGTTRLRFGGGRLR
jgi:hypothetical protein